LRSRSEPFIIGLVQSEFRYRGHDYSAAEIESIRQVIAAHPGLSRRRLSDTPGSWASACPARPQQTRTSKAHMRSNGHRMEFTFDRIGIF
jgi:hypothetical protein